MDLTSTFPTELMAELFASTIEVDHDPSAFLTSLRASVRSLIDLSHVSKRFRQISLNTPQLWTLVPHLNDVHPDFVKIILDRSHQLPLSLSFTEGSTLPLDTALWTRIIAELDRCASLCIEVDQGSDGRFARLILTMRAPSLRDCLVTFHGSGRNVCLNFDGSRFRTPFDGFAPHLQSMTLTGCYIPSSYCKLPALSSLSIYHRGGAPMRQSSLSIHNRPFGNSYSRLLRKLVLWNCFSLSQLERDVDSPPIELPLLEDLTVCGRSALLQRLATLLVYPQECLCSVNVLFPPIVDPTDASDAVKGVAAFVRDREEFSTTVIKFFDASRLSIRLMASDRRDVFMTFDFQTSDVSSSNAIDLVVRFINILSSALLPSISPLDVFVFNLWDSLATILGSHLTSVTHVQIDFPDDCQSSTIPSFLQPFLSTMSQACIAAFSPSNIFSNIFFYRLLRTVLPNICRILVSVSDEISEDLKTGIVDLVNARAEEACIIKEVYLALPSSFTQGLGHAKEEAICAMLGGFEVPSTTSIMFMEI